MNAGRTPPPHGDGGPRTGESSPPTNFGPSASWEVLRQRAHCLDYLRRFFAQRGYLEVETPVLASQSILDAHIEPLTLDDDAATPARRLYLQTSPESFMKRMLAAGSGSIYQIARVFRKGEAGAKHNPEFSMVEWYRVDGDYHALMTEIEEMVGGLRPIPAATRLTYREAFVQFAGIDPYTATEAELAHRAGETGFHPSVASPRDLLLDALLVNLVEPALARMPAVFLYDYPASQAALAQVRADWPPVAERFELYLDGIEMCNGYQELRDAEELARRQQALNADRVHGGKSPLPEPTQLIAAMQAGLPQCAGVALGFDRLVQWYTGTDNVGAVLAFPFDRV